MTAPSRQASGGSDPGCPTPGSDSPSGPDILQDVPDLIPARMLNEFVYCPRLFYLEFVQAQFADSADTIEGRLEHRRTEAEVGQPPSPHTNATAEAEEPSEQPAPREARPARSLTLSAPRAGLIARIDLLEPHGRRVTPVDYKRGSVPRDLPEQAWEPDRIQLCAQAIILRENGYRCEQGVLYYAASKTRVSVPIDEALVRRTLEIRDEARAVAAAGKIPPPLQDSPKCPRCSLVGICLPDEVRTLTDLAGGRPTPCETRRLVPARQDALPVYVQAQGGTIGKSGDRLYIIAKDQPRQVIRLLDVAQLNLFGNVQVSTQALRELVRRGVPICYFSFGGWFQAITTDLTHKNVELRIRQYEVAQDPTRRLQMARAFIAGKIQNGRTLLRRNCVPRPKAALRNLNDLRDRVKHAESIASLLGLEGNAARIYFQHLPGMLKAPADGTTDFDFASRNRRPPRDPVNALLSLAYALLVKDLTAVLLAVGFDPFLGFYHCPRYGRPALALDLAEEFRPIIADSVVIQIINTGQIQRRDFVRRGPACNLTPAGRRTFIAAYERRLDSLVTHPLFGYTISYRRILDVQARLLGACLLGEFPEYLPFTTR